MQIKVLARKCGEIMTTNLTAMLFSGLVATTGSLPGFAQPANLACGSLENGYGPYDYRTDKPKLPIVDGAHFTPAVEALIRGSTTSQGPGGDLDYTLRAFPNHHRALISVMRYGEKLKSAQPRDLPRPVECYFERALRFRSNDTLARMIYASFLSKDQRPLEATQQLELATVAAEDNAFSHYNIGLIYFDIKNYDRALAQAHKAYGLGFGNPELRDQLKSVNKWAEADDKPSGADEKKP